MRGGRTLALALGGLLLAATPAFCAPDSKPASTKANTFTLLPPAPGPTGPVSAADREQIAAATATPLPPPCTGRSTTGVDVGTALGAAAGVAAGLALGDGDGWSKLGNAVLGLATGSTVGYLAGRAYDGPRTCAEQPEYGQRTVLLPTDDLDRRQRERADGPPPPRP